jgi:hypothetical protein
MATLTRELKAIITADTKRFRQATSQAARDAQGFGSKLKSGAIPALAMVGKVGGVAGAAIGVGLAAGLTKAALAASDAEASNARLSAQLKALGQNTAATRAKIDATVNSLSLMSGFDDEDVQDALTGMARSAGSADAAMKALPVTLDLARARQMDVGAAGKIMEKVLAGNTTSLKRYGIAVEKGTTPTQALALLQQKFAGQAKAFGETSAGGMERAKVAAENAFERIGVSLTPVMNALGNFAATYLPVIADKIASALEGVVGWVRTNWPQIRSVFETVFQAVGAFITTYVAPTFRAVVDSISEIVTYVRANWPQISATILPVLRTVGTIVGTTFSVMTQVITTAIGVIKGVIKTFMALLSGDFSGVIHGVRTIISSVFGGIKGIITTAIGGAVSAALNLARGIGNAVLRVGEFLAQLPGKIVSALGSALSTAVSWVGQRFIQVGSAIVSAIVSGIKSAPGKVMDAIWELVPGPLQSVVRKLVPGMATSFSKAVTGAILQARTNLAGLANNLGGLAAERASSMYRSAEGKAAGDYSAAAGAARAAQDAVYLKRREDELKDAASASYETEAEKAKAIQDLADFYEEQRIAGLEREAAAQEAAAAKAGESAQTAIANLTASFNAGTISADEFKDSLRGIIGGDMGEELGSAFQQSFNQSLADVLTQATLLTSDAIRTVTGLAGGTVSDPGETYREENAAYTAWVNKRKAFTNALAQAKPDGKWKSEKVQKAFLAKWKADDVAEWVKEHQPPPRSTKKLANGGIIRRAILAGEAGPEAVVPLTGNVGRNALARAMRDAGSMAGGTTVVVNVAGNEFSAEEFARKVGPELRRQISLTGSW